MDWNSPTAKKHISEAKAQECELLGPGKTHQRRIYRLPCGHEKEIYLHAMRSGAFRCQVCAAKQSLVLDWNSPVTRRHINEARLQNCQLIDIGKDHPYRKYRLPCGHEQQVRTSAMRAGQYRCQTCKKDKLRDEVAKQGCLLVRKESSTSRVVLKLPCGHEQKIRLEHFRKGRFSCTTCKHDRLVVEAIEQECSLIGPGRDRNYRTYKLSCGHEQEIAMHMMRKGQFQCQTCIEQKLENEAAAQGCVVMAAGRNCRYRVYKLPCGHETELVTAHIRTGKWKCPVCLQEKHTREAEAHGCEIIGPGKRYSHNRVYRLPCGHEQEVDLRNMRLGNFRCQTCEDYFYTLPSNAYLLHIKIGPDEWLKLGYAKDVDFRASRYGLPSDANVSVLATKPFDTGKEAREFEGLLHKKYKRKVLKAEEMSGFHTKSGQTECYPLTLVDQLVAEFQSSN